MKITLYTITDCQFSKQEKEYLKSHNLPFEEKNLETNREFLTEMLTISNNFAGTPVTKIDKDDGQIAVLKGFTQKEFDELLGFSASVKTTADEAKPVDAAQNKPADETKPTNQPVQAPTASPEPKAEEPVATPQAPEVAAPPTPAVPETPPAQVDPKMENVLNNLQAQANGAPIMPEVPPAAPPATPAMPSIPDPQL